MTRQRKTRSFKLDELVLLKLNDLAKRKNMSANRCLEITLMDVLKSEGLIDRAIEPLGETRGGQK